VRPCCVGAAACDRDAAHVRGAACVRPWLLRASLGACDRGACCVLSVAGRAFERTKCGRTHFGRFYTLCPLSSPC
jgi:hypothetical protein